MRLFTLLLALIYSQALWAMNVIFINPGRSDEAYWVTAGKAMEAAARKLDMHLEVIYAEREHFRVVSIARQILDRPKAARPDYVIFSNDYGTGPELLRLFDEAGIKTFMAFSGITNGFERQKLGLPREHFKGWLGSLEPHAEDAGYQTAKRLIQIGRQAKAHGSDGMLHMLVISGDRSTPSSLRRSAGMRKAVFESADVVVDQEVYGAWSREKAEEQATWLYQRYPGSRLIWAGNDLMAFGAMSAWEKRGGAPGRDAWFSGINTSTEAMDSLRSGRLSALSGGHFIAGAWALVMLYDFHHGRDFAKEEGFELDQSMFVSFTPQLASRFLERYGKMDFDQVDFRRFSKVLNPGLKHYDFSFGQLLK